MQTAVSAVLDVMSNFCGVKIQLLLKAVIDFYRVQQAHRKHLRVHDKKAK